MVVEEDEEEHGKSGYTDKPHTLSWFIVEIIIVMLLTLSSTLLPSKSHYL